MKKYKEIDKYLEENRIRRKFSFIWEDSWKKYRKYLVENKMSSDDSVVGAIVMNANPFTKGHKHLVEYASKQVDYLYLFVLQEEKSQFSFEDRFAMVKLGTAEYKNVSVLKGGEFIISGNTFPEYFDSEEKCVDCSKDIEIFACLIAPIFNIKTRFVGREPYSVITNQYNEQMKKILPEYDIELVEIERLAIKENTISATKVRKAKEEKNECILLDMLPETSIKYMLENDLM